MSETPYPPKGTMDSFVKTHNEQILRGKLYEMQPGPELVTKSVTEFLLRFGEVDNIGTAPHAIYIATLKAVKQ